MELSWSTARGSLVAATPFEVAPMLVVPRPIPEARPVVLITATEVFEELQVAVLLTSFVEPSLKRAVAAYCKEPQVAVAAGGRSAERLPPGRGAVRAGRAPWIPRRLYGLNDTLNLSVRQSISPVMGYDSINHLTVGKPFRCPWHSGQTAGCPPPTLLK